MLPTFVELKVRRILNLSNYGANYGITFKNNPMFQAINANRFIGRFENQNIDVPQHYNRLICLSWPIVCVNIYVLLRLNRKL